jgi:hypothetical protein
MRVLLLISAFILLTSALNSTPFTSQKGGHCYTIDIPDYMVSTYNLNDVASIQYENAAKEAYTIVIEDSKAQLESIGIKFMNPKEFLMQFTSGYLLEAVDRKLGSVSEFVSNGYNHSQTEMSWDQDGILFFMVITAVETNTHFYKILSWSIVENKQSLYEDFIKISKSLKD